MNLNADVKNVDVTVVAWVVNVVVNSYIKWL